MSNVYRLTVEFDALAWQGLTIAERNRWVDDAVNALNDVAYCSKVEVEK